eukprot:scaffold976_cov214-Ochromonas_danica.AAC.13
METLQESMPTGWINANESSPPGGNGNIPSNIHDKVVHAQVIPMIRSTNNKTNWGIRVSFYLRGNSKKKGRQQAVTIGYAFVSLVDRFGHGYKAKWKKYRTSRDSLSPPPQLL